MREQRGSIWGKHRKEKRIISKNVLEVIKRFVRKYMHLDFSRKTKMNRKASSKTPS